MSVRLQVNGVEQTLDVDPGTVRMAHTGVARLRAHAQA